MPATISHISEANMISYETTSTCLGSPETTPRKTSSQTISKTVQELNNKACVLIAMEDFPKANQLLSEALQQHKRAVEERRHVYVTEYAENDSLDGDMSVSSSAIDQQYGLDDMDSSNDSIDYNYDCPRDQEQGTTNALPASSTFTKSDASPTYNISRMKTCSHVRTVPCAGQPDSTHCPQHKFHQVYSLPIVMDETEWERASPDDQSFVLVFNSALSNHLCGMKLLSLTGANCDQGPFETARALYLLALETLWNTGAMAGFQGGRIRSVDKLCLPAIFNNLSHASKLLDGYASKESSAYDSVLLKSVFWWIDGNSSAYGSSSSFTGSDLRRSSDGDEEVIEAFIDTVFYLIGVPESVVPAAAA